MRLSMCSFCSLKRLGRLKTIQINTINTASSIKDNNTSITVISYSINKKYLFWIISQQYGMQNALNRSYAERGTAIVNGMVIVTTFK